VALQLYRMFDFVKVEDDGTARAHITLTAADEKLGKQWQDSAEAWLHRTFGGVTVQSTVETIRFAHVEGMSVKFQIAGLPVDEPDWLQSYRRFQALQDYGVVA
jgi:hypothetical protein